MAVNVVAVDNAPELLEKIEGIFRNMAEVSLLGSFEEAVALVEFVKENPGGYGIYGYCDAGYQWYQSGKRTAETEKCSGGSADVQYSGFFSGGMENSGIRIHRKTVHEAGYHENGRAIPKRVGKWR